MHYALLFIPLLTAFTGWLSIRLLTTLLFYPQQPKKILGVTIQGALPKYTPTLTTQLAGMVGKKLFSFRSLEEKITHPSSIEKVMPFIEQHIDQFLREKLPAAMPVVSMFIGDKTIQQLKGVFLDELKTLFPALMSEYMATLESELDLPKMIQEKLTAFSMTNLQPLFQQALGKQLRKAALLGGLLGLLIGLLQLALIAIA